MVRKKVALQARELRGALYANVVLAAAEEEFATHGFSAARMQRVAQRAGVSVGLVYKQFESKEALYGAIHKLRGPVLMERMHAALSQPGTLPQLIRAAIEAHVQFCAEYPSYLRLQLARGTAWATGAGHFTKKEQRDIEQVQQLTREMMQAGIARGELVQEDPVLIATTLIAVQQAYLQRWVDDGMREPPAELSSRIAALFQRMYAL